MENLEVKRQRAISDGKLLEGGAQYDGQGRLILQDYQIENKRREMDAHFAQIEKDKEEAIKRNEERAKQDEEKRRLLKLEKFCAEKEPHIKVESNDCKILTTKNYYNGSFTNTDSKAMGKMDLGIYVREQGKPVKKGSIQIEYETKHDYKTTRFYEHVSVNRTTKFEPIAKLIIEIDGEKTTIDAKGNTEVKRILWENFFYELPEIAKGETKKKCDCSEEYLDKQREERSKEMIRMYGTDRLADLW